MKLHIGDASITISKGDITEEIVEAIAIPSNSRLWMGGNLAEVIKRKAGEDVETEAMKQGPVDMGQVVITSAGELSQKYILHAVIMGQDLKPTMETIKNGTRNVLNRAEEMGIESIAVPCFGTSVGKFPPKQAAQAMVEQFVNVLLDAQKLRDIRIILHNETIYKAFIEEFEQKFSK